MPAAYSFTDSKALWAEAQQLIAGGSQGTRQPEAEEAPIYFERAKGCRMWDVDGNEFIDLLCSIGPILLGYAYDRVDDAVRAIMETSFQSSMNHPIQLELARILIDYVPCAERVRFLKTGTEATQAAVRLARQITGRAHVARHGYHGWADMFKRGCGIGTGVHHGSWDTVYEFDGTAAGFYDLLGPDCGGISVAVDGGRETGYRRFDAYCTYRRIGGYEVASGLSTGRHTVTVTVDSASFDKRAILFEHNRPDYDEHPDRYDGLWWYLGGILLNGHEVNR